MSSVDQRREQRFHFESIVLPFLGSREEDHMCFEYIPLDISANGLRIAIPKWVVSRENLHDGDDLNLHVPFRLDDRTLNLGRIVWAKWDEEMQAQVCGVRMASRASLKSPFFIVLETREVGIDLQNFSSEHDMVLKLLKDSILLKKGVLIYMNHLIPYFSRVTLYPTESYPMLRELLLDDVRKRIEENLGRLEALYETAREEFDADRPVSIFLNLEELRSMVESEIYLDIFKITFDTDAILPFLSAIKELEKRQYASYNTMVMAYIKSL